MDPQCRQIHRFTWRRRKLIRAPPLHRSAAACRFRVYPTPFCTSPRSPPTYLSCSNSFGYSSLHCHNTTHMEMRLYSDDTYAVTYNFWVTRKWPRPY